MQFIAEFQITCSFNFLRNVGTIHLMYAHQNGRFACINEGFYFCMTLCAETHLTSYLPNKSEARLQRFSCVFNDLSAIVDWRLHQKASTKSQKLIYIYILSNIIYNLCNLIYITQGDYISVKSMNI